MSELYNQIVQKLSDDVSAASADIHAERARYLSLVRDAEATVATLVKDPVQAVMEGASMSDIRKNSKDVAIAYEDAEIYGQVIAKLNKQIQRTEKPLLDKRTRINGAYLTLPNIKQKLLTHEAAGHNISDFKRTFDATLNNLIRELDAAGFDFDTIKALKAEITHVEKSILEE